MSRCTYRIAFIMVLTLVTVAAAVAVPHKADAATLRQQLRAARVSLRHSQARLTAAEADLAAAVAATALPVAAPSPTPDPSPAPDATPSATPTPCVTPTPAAPSIDDLKAAATKARHAVRVWQKRVHRLARLYAAQRQMAEWERTGQWMPIIKVAAARYHVRADGMYRMMMRESHGERYAGASTSFKGLFQYYTGTWSASWNPWRHESIYDASSQIFATALALHKGMGPQMWTTTYWSQY